MHYGSGDKMKSKKTNMSKVGQRKRYRITGKAGYGKPMKRSGRGK